MLEKSDLELEHYYAENKEARIGEIEFDEDYGSNILKSTCLGTQTKLNLNQE
jgi:hypothetical protein